MGEARIGMGGGAKGAKCTCGGIGKHKVSVCISHVYVIILLPGRGC